MDLTIKVFRNQFWMVVLAILALQLPAIYPVLDYVPVGYRWSVYSYWLVACLGYSLIYQSKPCKRLTNIFDHWWPTLFMVTFMTVLNIIVYPIIDGRKEGLMGSDRDDAIMLVAQRLLAGESPYHITTYLGNIPTSGPGIVLFLLPFAVFKCYSIYVPMLLVILAYLLHRRMERWVHVNLFLALLASSPLFWKLLISGSDLLGIGLIMSIIVLLIDLKKGRYWQIGICVFVSMILTSRIIFIYLAPVYALLIVWKNSFQLTKWIGFTMIISAGTVLIHFIFWVMDPHHYGPWSLLSLGGFLLNIKTLLIAALICLVSIRLSVNIKPNIIEGSFLLWYWIYLILLLIILAQYYSWGTGLHSYPFAYLGVQLPVFCLFFVLNHKEYFTSWVKPKLKSIH